MSDAVLSVRGRERVDFALENAEVVYHCFCCSPLLLAAVQFGSVAAFHRERERPVCHLLQITGSTADSRKGEACGLKDDFSKIIKNLAHEFDRIGRLGSHDSGEAGRGRRLYYHEMSTKWPRNDREMIAK